ncbi:DUF2252 family protein [Paenibacillus doosanensis]|uniref:DUF2252 family protein n=1 Tax=Paenibacillus doosanensis TaxID=1229154 RepID=UPI00217FB14B|nr:DUF2252 family protein [Paenibacillus doosanensis]MCS7460044.1 DUF2252 family protein [Paenibacillus doosanensis]
MRTLNQRWMASILAAAVAVQSLWTVAGTSYAAASSACTVKIGNLAENVVISQFYGGKANDTDSLYAQDFVELFNPTAQDIPLSGWSVQFADNGKSNWKKVDLGTKTADIPAYGYYLIGLGSNGTVGANKNLPSSDAEQPAFKLDNNLGKLVLSNQSSALTAADPMADPLASSVVDFVGYGAVDAYCGTPAPEAGKKNTIQRYVFDPLNPATSRPAAAYPNRGNNWDTRNNGRDFEKVNSAKPRNSDSTAAYAIAESSQTVRMSSSSDVDPDYNAITLKAVNGIVKQGAWDAGDFAVVGLPAGLTAAASANGDEIKLTVTGDGSGNVAADTDLAVSIFPGAWNQTNRPTAAVIADQGPYTITLAKYTPANKIVGAPEPASSAIRMSGAKELNAQFQIQLSAGVPWDSVISSTYYSVNGLPAGDWTIKAEGRSKDSMILFSVAGIANSPVMNTMQLSVTLNGSAVQGEGWQDSDPITGISLLRYSQPVRSDEARKNAVKQNIIADNTFFNDPAIKAYKYGSDVMGANAFTFFRGTNALFRSDLNSGVIPSPGTVIPGWKEILTYTQGDAHIQNVGTFNDNKGAMVFDLNDPDSAGIGSFYNDLLRFVTSVYVVKSDKDSTGISSLQDADFRDVSQTFLETYKNTLLDIRSDAARKADKLTRSNVTTYTQKVMDKVSTGSYDEALQKLLGKRAANGKIKIVGNEDKYEPASEAEIAEVTAAWEAYKAELRRNFPNLDDEQFNSYFTIKDIARRIHQGIGSVGATRYNVLIEGASAAGTDDILLDVKEQLRDAYLSKDAYLKMSPDTDAYLGVLKGSGCSYLVREVSPFKGDYTDKTFSNKADLEQYVTDAAKAYAYAHARLNGISAQLNYKFEDRFAAQIVPVWGDLEAFILNAAEDYSHQVAADFALVHSDMLAGKLIDVSTLDALSVNAGALSPPFAAGVTQYEVAVDHTITSIEMKATATDSKATLTAKGSPYASGTVQSFSLSVGTNAIPFTITAQDGSVRTYTVNVTRGAAAETGSAELSGLTLSNGTMSPAFSPDITAYTAQVGNGVSSLAVTANVYDSAAELTVNGLPAASGQASAAIPLNVGGNVIEIAVAAKDGVSKTYTVNAVRAAAITASGDTPVQIASDPVSISVPAGAANARIAVTPVTEGDRKEAMLPLIEVQAATTLGNVTAVFPAGTKVSASAGWDGTIRLPEIRSSSGVIVSNAIVNAVIEVGAPDESLIFDQAVRLLIPNQGGNLAGFIKDGAVVPITGTVTEDTQEAANREIADGGDAVMTVGGDLVIWTKHFTQFVVYAPVTPSNRRNGGGGGGSASVNTGTVSGVDGGTLTLNGVRIEVPAAASDSSMQITVNQVSDTAGLPTNQAWVLLSDVYEITKDRDGDFVKPIVITLPYDNAKVDANQYTIGLYWLNEQTREWIPLDDQRVNTAGAEVSGSVAHFTKFAVLGIEKTGTTETPQTSGVNFSDMKGHWSEASVKDLVRLGAINGYPDGTFKPDNRITRAEFVTVIVKAFGLQQQNGKSFADTRGHWAQEAIATAAAIGIVDGYEDEAFGPDDLITREQAAAIVVRVAHIELSANDISFADEAEVSEWARAALAAAAVKGLINGYEEGTVRPKVNTTRAEAAAIVLRALQLK